MSVFNQKKKNEWSVSWSEPLRYSKHARPSECGVTESWPDNRWWSLEVSLRWRKRCGLRGWVRWRGRALKPRWKGSHWLLMVVQLAGNSFSGLDWGMQRWRPAQRCWFFRAGLNEASFYRGVVAVSMVIMMMMTAMAKTTGSNMKEGRHTATQLPGYCVH